MNGLHSLLTVAVLHDRGVSGCAAFRRAFFIGLVQKAKWSGSYSSASKVTSAASRS